MVKKCANPKCKAEFRYARLGRLFPFELRHPKAPCHDVSHAICDRESSHGTVYFWLCEDCCSKFTLRFAMEAGLSLVPMPESTALATRQIMQGRAVDIAI